jgi:hypothetical protein
MSRKQEMINCLIENDLKNIYGSSSDGIQSILQWGFKGYQNMEEKELIDEMTDRDLWDTWFKDEK